MNGVQQLEQAVRFKSKPKPKRWETLTDWARARGACLVEPVARVLGRLGVHPNTVTIIGTLLLLGVGVLFGLGYLRLGGWLLLAVAPVDFLDGTLARATGKQSRFGAFLDSTLDRLSDAALLSGLLAYAVRQQAWMDLGLLVVSLVATLMISYTRARAEALGFPCKVGLLSRLERIVLIGVLLGLGLHAFLVWALALCSVITVIQRIVYVYVMSRRDVSASDV